MFSPISSTRGHAYNYCSSLDVPVVCGKIFYTERVINLLNTEQSATNCQFYIIVII